MSRIVTARKVGMMTVQGVNNNTTINDIMKSTLEYLSGERENALAYTVVDAIPYTENGKLDYRKLENYKFGSSQFYIIEDPITVKYFEDIPKIKMISIT